MKTKNNKIEYLKGIKELLIVVDMVNGFINEGSLAAPNIKRVVPRQIELIKKALDNDNMGVAFVRDAHTSDAMEFNTYPSHCIKETTESELIDELKVFEKDSLTYLKNSTNLIFAPNIQNDLLKLKFLKRIYLMGCLSEVCILNGAIGLKTYFDELNKNIEICVYSDTIDTYDNLNHKSDEVTEKALCDMESNGIKILRKEK